MIDMLHREIYFQFFNITSIRNIDILSTMYEIRKEDSYTYEDILPNSVIK